MNKREVEKSAILEDNILDEKGCYQGYNKLYVILLSKSPNKELTKELIKEHVLFLHKLEKNNKLVLCGPFSDYDGGMIIIKAASISEAKEIALSDPFVINGVEKYEVRTWELSCESNNHMGIL